MKNEKSPRSRAVRIFFSDPWSVAATAVLLLLVLACFVLPFFLKYSYLDTDGSPTAGVLPWASRRWQR